MVQPAFEIEKLLPATFTAPGLTEAEFLEFCAKLPDATLEYTPDGTLIIMPPTDPETSARVTRITTQLERWAVEKGHGIVVGPDGGFRLPGGSRRSPDASWFDKKRWQRAKIPGTRFPTFAPDFVIEVRSPDDRMPALREKMQEYIASGVQLAWLIDPTDRTVAIYRGGPEPEILTNPASVSGEGPVAGFVLVLERVFTI